jgi:hypothetical protein
MAGVCTSPLCGAQITANVLDGPGFHPRTDDGESESEASELGKLQFRGVDEQQASQASPAKIRRFLSINDETAPHHETIPCVHISSQPIGINPVK